jgi:hypothetical protein
VLGKAKRSVKIIIPDIGIDFFYDDQIINALKRVVKKGVPVKVAYFAPSEIGKIGILGVPGIEIFRLPESVEPNNKLWMSIDAGIAIIEQKPRIREIQVGIIVTNVQMLAHEIDTIFDDLVGQ